MSSPPSWLEVRSVATAQTASLDHLGAGEREAILLAEEMHADWLIMDDYEGRLEANRRTQAVGDPHASCDGWGRGTSLDLVAA